MFNSLLKELRVQYGLTQSQLPKEAGVSPGNVGDWESGKSKPGYNALAALARIFEVSADYLLELDISPAKTNDNLSSYKVEQGLSCDGSPLDEEEVDLVAMYRLLPDYRREDVFDIIYTMYQKHVERKKDSIYWTYKADRLKQKGTVTDSDSSSSGQGGSPKFFGPVLVK